MTALELLNVSKVYGRGAAEVHALRDIDLTVEPGALVAVMGPSGSGKSTLLTIAGSLEDPTSGEVLVGGIALSGMSRNDKARLRRRSVGYVFQDFNLLAGLTAAENVALPLELDGTPARAARAVSLETLEKLGLAERAARFPDELSGGERQRVAIARALVNHPSLLLCDEPTGNLDSAATTGLTNLLGHLHAQGTTLVVITHNPAVGALAQRQIKIADGVLTETAPSPAPGAQEAQETREAAETQEATEAQEGGHGAALAG
jgi:putative ABC transport system ATP-binding protein